MIRQAYCICVEYFILDLFILLENLRQRKSTFLASAISRLVLTKLYFKTQIYGSLQ